MRRLAAVVAVAAVLGVSPALAQPSRTPPVDPTPAAPAPYAYAPGPLAESTHTERYGTTIALVDGASFLAIIVGAIVFAGAVTTSCDDCSGEDDGDAALGVILMVGGVGGYYLGGPLVHNSKGNSSGAWKSLGARVLLPLAGSLIAAGADDPDTSDAAASLSAVGVLGAMVLDWFVFAKREVRDPPTWGPYARSISGGGGVVGLGGTF
jgi:hypothetical protein